MNRKFKSNVCYVLDVDGNYYIGSHCVSRSYLREGDILSMSGNPLNNQRTKGIISYEDYKKRVHILDVLEFDTIKEAQDKERELIKTYKEKYGEKCLNKHLKGNINLTGRKMDKEWCEHISIALKKAKAV